MADNRFKLQGGDTMTEGRESMKEMNPRRRKKEKSDGASGRRRIRNGLILGLVTTILLGMFIALKPAIANAASVQQYSGGSMKLYIDRDCFQW